MDREHILTQFDMKPCDPGIQWAERFSSWTELWEEAERPEWMMWMVRHAYGNDRSDDRFIALEDLIIESIRDNTLGFDDSDNQEEADFLRVITERSPFNHLRVSNIISFLDDDVRICQYIRNIFPQPVEDI